MTAALLSCFSLRVFVHTDRVAAATLLLRALSSNMESAFDNDQ